MSLNILTNNVDLDMRSCTVQYITRSYTVGYIGELSEGVSDTFPKETNMIV